MLSWDTWNGGIFPPLPASKVTERSLFILISEQALGLRPPKAIEVAEVRKRPYSSSPTQATW